MHRLYYSAVVLALLLPICSSAQVAMSKGALSYYQLRGPVKAVEFEVDFDLGDIDIADSWSVGYYDITRICFDKNGKIILPWDDVYTYDSSGRLSTVNWEIKITDDMFSVPGRAFYWAEKFRYDEHGNLLSYEETVEFNIPFTVTLKYNSAGDVVGYEGGRVVYYTVLKKDKWGNWLERRTSEGKIERRSLEYYE